MKHGWISDLQSLEPRVGLLLAVTMIWSPLSPGSEGGAVVKTQRITNNTLKYELNTAL